MSKSHGFLRSILFAPKEPNKIDRESRSRVARDVILCLTCWRKKILLVNLHVSITHYN